ncbi:TetR/AcrR family transcriptional regulator [Solimonas sp. K1W22B-7]|uniref:TetR/AcrR family transcriptional regulator n=1 Tax=Solimonas sp. K1W22B-7 TaxID=2303331 RepID=UPI000E3321B2|nr:TetR/AcrR family transcriptional regulator [Solimonas sp. K1W22B-7]AXQ28719.1 TetR/AcrR family transcriptional regulator [Solimonas sp. K1W22B-7]
MSSSAAGKTGRDRAGAAPRVGRPPSVTVPQIVAAALELGLDNFSLKQIADHLGVGLATLYRHVGTRDELLRLASFELMLRRQAPATESAHWSEVALQYAETLLQSFLAEPQLITELQRGRLGPHAEVDLLEKFLGVITRHGFSIDDGVRLFHAIGTLVVGTATGMAGHRASEASGESWKLETRRVLGARDDDELPLVRRAYPQFIEPGIAQWQFTIRNLLAGVAASRGETLPAELSPKPAADRAVSIKRKSRPAG